MAVLFFGTMSCSNRPGETSNYKEKGKLVDNGYSTMDSHNYTGSASQVDILKQGIPLEDYLRGVSGVYVLGNGSSAAVRVRGIANSFSSDSEPLFVLNGISINGGFSAVNAMVNTNTIKSISVLKDAASSAIYGSRAANGVIVIALKTNPD